MSHGTIDVFSISGRGTVATGRVERGIATKGADVEIVGLGAHFKTTLTGIGAYTEPLSHSSHSDPVQQKCSTRSSTGYGLLLNSLTSVANSYVG